MNKKIIILNGAARKNGSTAGLVEAFEDGAKSAGNQVKTFYLDGMEIHSCKGCLKVGRDSKSPCSQKDDMEQIYAEFEDADVIVFAYRNRHGGTSELAEKFCHECGIASSYIRESVLHALSEAYSRHIIF